MNNELQDAIDTLNKMTERLEEMQEWIREQDYDVQRSLCIRYCLDVGDMESAKNPNVALLEGENLRMMALWLLDSPNIAEEIGFVEKD